MVFKWLMRKILRPTVIIVIVALLLFPFMTGLVLSGLFYFNGDKILVESVEVEYLDSVSKDLTARDYLNLSNGLAHEYRESGHVCRQIANATLSVYQTLIDESDRPELSNQVRMASGMGTRDVGHVWLEINENNEWVPYETTLLTPVLSANEVQSYSETNKTVRSNLASDFTVDSAEYRALPGTQVFVPTSTGYFSYYSTAASAVYHAINEGIAQVIASI